MGTRRYTWRHVEEGRCGFCEQRHALELEYRCVDCDRAVCALCVVVVRRSASRYCPECAPEGEDG